MAPPIPGSATSRARRSSCTPLLGVGRVDPNAATDPLAPPHKGRWARGAPADAPCNRVLRWAMAVASSVPMFVRTCPGPTSQKKTHLPAVRVDVAGAGDFPFRAPAPVRSRHAHLVAWPAQPRGKKGVRIKAATPSTGREIKDRVAQSCDATPVRPAARLSFGVRHSTHRTPHARSITYTQCPF